MSIPDRQERIIAFLQDTGTIQRFRVSSAKTKKGLGGVDWVVLNPSFLINMMKCIVSLKNTVIRDGLFSREDLPKIFDALHAANSQLTITATKEGIYFHLPISLIICC